MHHQGHFGIKKIARRCYVELQLLPIPTHRWKGISYDLIPVIVTRLTKMIHYKPKITIDTPWLPRLNCQRLRLSFHLQVLAP